MNRITHLISENALELQDIEDVLLEAGQFLLTKILRHPVCLYYGTEVAMSHVRPIHSIHEFFAVQHFLPKVFAEISLSLLCNLAD